MANELAILKDNWLEVADKLNELPAPFQQEIYLLHCNVAGTTHVDDIEAKTKDLAEGDLLTLRRDLKNEFDPRAIGIYTAKQERIGWVPRRDNIVFARLMDAGKLLYARVAGKELVEDNWINITIKIYMRDG